MSQLRRWTMHRSMQLERGRREKEQGEEKKAQEGQKEEKEKEMTRQGSQDCDRELLTKSEPHITLV
ncbi:MAG: hypothetical protein ACYC0X_01365 [Pirellulaceae bacterium]